MNIKEVMQVKTKEEARRCAIEWQNWVSEVDLTYKELHNWNIVFNAIGAHFGLKDEFFENGII